MSGAVTQSGSSSIDQPGYWWHDARGELLRAALGDWLGGRPGDRLGPSARLLDVGSADGPSARWLHGDHQRVAVDTDPRGLTAGRDVCASALRLPFADETFDVVAAFDVIEHCDPESVVVAELARVLRPGGRLLVSVPAYTWAWSDHDVRAGHHRRYTRARLVRALEGAGLAVERSTHAFALVFPVFAVERLARRLRRPGPSFPVTRAQFPADPGPVSGEPAASRLPQPPPPLDRLLRTLCRAEARLLPRLDLPFGSSVLAAAVKG